MKHLYLVCVIAGLQVACAGSGDGGGTPLVPTETTCENSITGIWRSVTNSNDELGISGPLCKAVYSKGMCGYDITFTPIQAGGRTTLTVRVTDPTRPADCLSLGTHSCRVSISGVPSMRISCDGYQDFMFLKIF